jgi:hypothetical protein
MRERKKIDRLFQEKFKDFEALPPLDAWKNIEARLDEKKKRRIIPFWFRISGVAAILLIGLFIGKNLFLTNEIESRNPVTNSNTNPKSNSTNEKGNTIPLIKKSDEAVVVNENYNSLKTNKNSVPTNTNIQNQEHKKSDIKTDKLYKSPENNRIISNNSNTLVKTERHPFSNTKEQKLAQNNAKKRVPNFEKNNLNDHSTLVISENKTTADKVNELNLNVDNSKKTNYSQEKTESDNSNELNDRTLVTLKEKSLLNKDDLHVTNDSLSVKNVVKNELEELLKEKESIKQMNTKENRWQLASSVAPIFLGSLSNGSAIDPMFENNSKSYNTTLSYGIGIGYNITNKLTIRSGINKLDMNYDTNNVVFSTSLSSARMQNINSSSVGSNIQLHNGASFTSQANNFSEDGFLPFETSILNQNQGFLRQQIGFVEVPLELTYAIVNKRFGVDFIGGLSTLLLQENNITLVSNEANLYLGKANNINTFNFSTNLGVGVRYRMFKSLHVNVEPMFKYQLNTFRSGSSNFKPYVFGVYSGLRYNF